MAIDIDRYAPLIISKENGEVEIYNKYGVDSIHYGGEDISVSHNSLIFSEMSHSEYSLTTNSVVFIWYANSFNKPPKLDLSIFTDDVIFALQYNEDGDYYTYNSNVTGYLYISGDVSSYYVTIYNKSDLIMSFNKYNSSFNFDLYNLTSSEINCDFVIGSVNCDEIYLYKNEYIEDYKYVDGVIRNDFSIESPSIIMENNIEDVNKYNYFIIQKFHRMYYISDITFNSYNIYTLSLVEDYIGSHSESILIQKANVDRATTYILQPVITMGGDFIDDLMVFSDLLSYKITTIDLNVVSNYGRYVLKVMTKNGSENILPNCSIYICTYDNIIEFLEQYSQNDNTFTNLSQVLLGIYYLPMGLSDNAHDYISGFVPEIVLANGTHIIFSEGVHLITKYYNVIRDIDIEGRNSYPYPYNGTILDTVKAKYYMYHSNLGLIEVNPYFAHNHLNFKIVCDFVSGCADCIINSDGIEIFRTSIPFLIELPYGTINSGDIARNQYYVLSNYKIELQKINTEFEKNLLSGISTTLTGILSTVLGFALSSTKETFGLGAGFAMSGGSQLMSGSTNIVNAVAQRQSDKAIADMEKKRDMRIASSPTFSISRSSGSFAGVYNNEQLYLITVYNDIIYNDYNKYVGYVCNITDFLDNFTGFTRCVFFRFNNKYNMLYNEIEQVSNIMKSGFIINRSYIERHSSKSINYKSVEVIDNVNKVDGVEVNKDIQADSEKSIQVDSSKDITEQLDITEDSYKDMVMRKLSN